MSVPIAGMWRAVRLATGETIQPEGGLYATVTTEGWLAAVAYAPRDLNDRPVPARAAVIPAQAVVELIGWLGMPGAIDWPLNIQWRVDV